MNQLLVSILFSILFLGGWRLFPGQLDILGVVWFVLKTMLVMLVIQLIQYTLPRLRIDQLLALNWKFLTPLALANICVIALVGQAVLYDAANPWAQAGALLLANVLILLVVMGLLVLAGRRARRRVEAWQAAQVEEEQLAVSG